MQQQSLQKSIIIKRPFGTSLGGCAARRAAATEERGAHWARADVGFAILTCMTSNIALCCLMMPHWISILCIGEKEKQSNLFFIFFLSSMRLFSFFCSRSDPNFGSTPSLKSCDDFYVCSIAAANLVLLVQAASFLLADANVWRRKKLQHVSNQLSLECMGGGVVAWLGGSQGSHWKRLNYFQHLPVLLCDGKWMERGADNAPYK